MSKHITKRFTYSILKTAYRKRELEPALHLLEKARLINLIYHTHGNGLPLGTEVDISKFKISMLDVALTQAILGLDIKDWFLNSREALINKGEITEAFIGQEFLAYADPTLKTNLYYWHREAKSSHAELDYLYQYQNKVMPIEVKSGHGAGLQSMRLYLKKHPKLDYGIRFAAYNYSFIDQIQTFPLYAAVVLSKNNPLIGKLLSSET